ncbi:ABC transporter C family member 13-like isoform X2 [Chenopodium quinoa]|uniref:ABC transporter C family member 13-like isoform X2 n=1 Tax=Chenopodium quinoa TaxID=63459 RepID=UPI000B7809B0|nr:ABC transporter C family member 13-like isoform X2 [Chenopodium quinoa]
MLLLTNFICTVWEDNMFSQCFTHLVFGCGSNAVTLILIAGIWILQGDARGGIKMHLPGRFIVVLPALEACVSFFDMVLILWDGYNGHGFLYHDLIYRCSQLSVWITILLLSRCDFWYTLCCSRLLCFWWVVKPLLLVPQLQIVISSYEVWWTFKECLNFLLDMAFGVCLNVVRIRQNSCSRSDNQLEDPLLSHDLEEGYRRNSGSVKTILMLMTFSRIKPIMDKGVMKQLTFEELLDLPSDMDPSSSHNFLLTSWRAQQIINRSNPSFFKAICSSYGWPYLRLGVLKVFNDCIGFAGPLLLNKLIQFLQQGSGGVNGFLLAVSLGLTSFLKSVLDTQYTYHLAILKLKLRAGIMTVIYQKCLSVSLAEKTNFSEGEIQTFMSVDADRAVNLCNSFHDIWSLPLQIGIALYLLYTQVSFAFVAGITITVFLIPVNKWIAKLIANATDKMMKQKDERIRRTGELLTYIRTLKMYCWEILFKNWVMETRRSEVANLSTRKYLDAWCVFFWATTPTLFSLCTFGLYTLMGHQLDAATVFTCVALFNTLISPLNSFPWVINGLVDAFISTRRLSRFLACPEHSLSRGKSSLLYPTCLSVHIDDALEDKAITFHDASFSWSNEHIIKDSFRLDNVNLSLPKDSFVVIVGEVGSGKSSLLNSMLGEMNIIEGWVHLNGSTAYVPQVPWILSGTIRENILLGKEHVSERYAEVLRACALDVDISLMPGGDMAYVGDKGANLSGGQRVRIALARAIYHMSDILLLDDVLSAVDAQVARSILDNVIHGPLMNQQTCVLCTHNIQAILSADIVVYMSKGCVKLVGSPADLASCSEFSAHTALSPLLPVQNQEKSVESICEVNENSSEEKECIQISSEAEETVELEERKEGNVELAVYRKYAAFSGWFLASLILISAAMMQASRNGNDLWLSYWVDTTKGNDRTHYSLTFYLVILSVFCILNSVLTLVRAFSFAFGGLRAAMRVHDSLLNNLVNSPVLFFDRTPRGRIINRLSSDLYTIDDSLPFIFNILLANFVGLLGVAIVLSYVQIILLLLLLPFWYIYKKLQFYYRSTSRELRRLDSVSRSPIYASFTETLDGSSTIRAFKSEEFFFSKFTSYVEMYQRTSYTEITASLWLSLRLQLLAAFLISFIAIMAIIGSFDKFPVSMGTSGLVGLALSYAAPIVSLLGSFLSSFTETEKEMVAVERVVQYMDIPQEELCGSIATPRDWPYQGRIEFQNVILRYLPSLPPALCDISFTIAGGTQVGIVGRTGAGKSSIVNALFRLSPICGGCILVDDVNIDLVSVRDLRSRFAVVPQSPFLFQGSVRENLDPFQLNDDMKLWEVLEKCRIKEEIEAVGGLDMQIKESEASFSVGQRQLLCLARALLKSSKVMFLDECTANIDIRTASLLQNVIFTACQGMTVITIAHRISTVLSMDDIFVLEKGTLVEQGNPQILLQDDHSKFAAFTRASLM